MAVVRNLIVRAGADFSAISTQAKQASTSMSSMSSSVTKACSRMSAAAKSANRFLGAIGATISVAAVATLAKSAKQAYDEQTEASAKLAQVMSNTMDARADEVASVEALIDAQERLGVIRGDAQTEGAQELATYLTLSSSLRTLIPVLNDMTAQQYGLSASSESVLSIATMMGKVMIGQTSALSRYGYSFTAAQEAVLKYGTEEQRAATLADVVSESVGGMNAALAATPSGRLVLASNALGKIQEEFGRAVSSVTVLFLPAMNTACSVLANMATLANQVAQTLTNVFGGAAAGAAKTVSYTAAAATAVGDLADESTAAGKAASAMENFGFDTLQKLSGSSSAGAAAETAQAGSGTSAGQITETAAGADESGKSIAWLEGLLAKLQTTAAGLNFTPLVTSLTQLQAAAAPLTAGLFSGLSWAYSNVLEPLAGWTVEEALPAFLRALGGAASVCSSALSALQPLANWLWTSFLQPVAAWTGGAIVSILGGLTTALYGISDWISANQELVRGMTVLVAAFCAAWTITSIAAFVVNAGGVASILGKVTAALKACTVAKVADKAMTAAICALYVKDWAVALAANTVALGKNVAAWVVLRAEWVVANAKLVAMTVAHGAHTVATWACTAATTALGVAINVLTSPITLVIAAVAALVAGVVLLVKNWDTVRTTAAAVWDNVKQIWGAAGEWFQSRVLTPITEGFKGFANGIIGFFEGLVNGAIGGINFIIGAFNRISFSIPDWVPVIGGKTWGFSLATMAPVALPRLANGAVFEGNNPFLAVVNDQKHGVNVEAPLTTIVEAMRVALREMNFGSGDIQIDVRAVFEGQLAALARVLNPYFEAEAVRVGGRASTAKGVS